MLLVFYIATFIELFNIFQLHWVIDFSFLFFIIYGCVVNCSWYRVQFLVPSFLKIYIVRRPRNRYVANVQECWGEGGGGGRRWRWMHTLHARTHINMHACTLIYTCTHVHGHAHKKETHADAQIHMHACRHIQIHMQFNSIQFISFLVIIIIKHKQYKYDIHNNK